VPILESLVNVVGSGYATWTQTDTPGQVARTSELPPAGILVERSGNPRALPPCRMRRQAVRIPPLFVISNSVYNQLINTIIHRFHLSMNYALPHLSLSGTSFCSTALLPSTSTT